MNCLFSKEKAGAPQGWRQQEADHKNERPQQTDLARPPHQLSSSNIREPWEHPIMGLQTCTQHYEQSISKQRVRRGQCWIYLQAFTKLVLTKGVREPSQSKRMASYYSAGWYGALWQPTVHFHQGVSSSISEARFAALALVISQITKLLSSTY